MKWLRKKPSSSSSPSPNSSHAFPISWVSKFKQMRESPEKKQNSRFVCSPKRLAGYEQSRFCAQEGNDSFGYSEGGGRYGFWRLSLGEDNPDHDLQIKVAQRGNCRIGKSERSDKKGNGVQRTKTARKEGADHEDHHKTHQRIMQPIQQDHDNVFVPEQTDDHMGEFGGNSSHEMALKRQKQKVTENKKSISVRTEKEQIRKSIYAGGGSQERPSKQGKVKVTTPRTPSRRETCKIRSVESMKRAMEHKKKKKAKQEKSSQEAKKGMESFAVVKQSQDPQQDFRDSMMEMILEKGIKKPEEMEELLACYLTLNSDEYHDIIIKVFRQVWRELEDMQALNQQLEELYMVFDD